MPLRRPQVLSNILDQRPHLRRVALGVEIPGLVVLNRPLGLPVRHCRIHLRYAALDSRMRKPPHTHGTMRRLRPGARRGRLL